MHENKQEHGLREYGKPQRDKRDTWPDFHEAIYQAVGSAAQNSTWNFVLKYLSYCWIQNHAEIHWQERQQNSSVHWEFH